MITLPGAGSNSDFIAHILFYKIQDISTHWEFASVNCLGIIVIIDKKRIAAELGSLFTKF